MSYSVVVITNLLKSAFYVTDLTWNLYHNVHFIIVVAGLVKARLYKRTLKDQFWVLEKTLLKIKKREEQYLC